MASSKNQNASSGLLAYVRTLRGAIMLRRDGNGFAVSTPDGRTPYKTEHEAGNAFARAHAQAVAAKEAAS